MSHDDVLFGYRLRLFTLAAQIGVRPACRAMGVHHSTFYRWKAKVDRWGLEALRIRERRRPRMPNQTRHGTNRPCVSNSVLSPRLKRRHRGNG
jgi:hypothetical protein